MPVKKTGVKRTVIRLTLLLYKLLTHLQLFVVLKSEMDNMFIQILLNYSSVQPIHISVDKIFYSNYSINYQFIKQIHQYFCSLRCLRLLRHTPDT